MPAVKIAICVKEIPDPARGRRLDPASHWLDRSSDGALNAYDRHAIEAAVRLREAGTGDVEIVVVTMAPASASRSVDRALAQGADRSIHIADEALAGSDILVTSRVLAAAIARESPDLVLFGQQSADAESYVLPAAVAARLGLPVVTQAASLEVAEGTLRAKRQTETGYDTVEADLPAVVSVSDAINEPRYPALPAIMGAKRKPHETFTVADLGLDPAVVGAAGSGTRILAVSAPPARSGGERIEGTDGAAERIVAFLEERKLVSR